MEYVEGQPLSTIISEHAPITFRRFQNVFLPLLSALDHAHSKAIIHRDIKPSNIIVQRDEQGNETAKLVDFGIAKAVADSVTSTSHVGLTKTGSTIGSPTYMSPEQCQGKELDCRSDLYSLACVMYESLNGQPPFISDTSMDVMYKHIHEARVSTKELSARMEIPEVLVKAILWGLNKEPAKRPESAAKYSAKIASALDEITLDRSPKKAGKAKNSSRKRVAVGLLIASVVLGGLIAGSQLLPANHKRTPAIPAVTQSDTSKGKELLKKAQAYYNAYKFKESLETSEQAIVLLKRGSPSTLAEALMCASDSIHSMNSRGVTKELIQKQLNYSMEAFKIYSRLHAEPPKIIMAADSVIESHILLNQLDAANSFIEQLNPKLDPALSGWYCFHKLQCLRKLKKYDEAGVIAKDYLQHYGIHKWTGFFYKAWLEYSLILNDKGDRQAAMQEQEKMAKNIIEHPEANANDSREAFRMVFLLQKNDPEMYLSLIKQELSKNAIRYKNSLVDEDYMHCFEASAYTACGKNEIANGILLRVLREAELGKLRDEDTVPLRAECLSSLIANSKNDPRAKSEYQEALHKLRQ
jgi:serine/threonine protein kinase